MRNYTLKDYGLEVAFITIDILMGVNLINIEQFLLLYVDKLLFTESFLIVLKLGHLADIVLSLIECHELVVFIVVLHCRQDGRARVR